MEIFHWIFIRNKKLKVYWRKEFSLLKCLMFLVNHLNWKAGSQNGSIINILWGTVRWCLLTQRGKRKHFASSLCLHHFPKTEGLSVSSGMVEKGLEPGNLIVTHALVAFISFLLVIMRTRTRFNVFCTCVCDCMPSLLLKQLGSAVWGRWSF